MAPPHLHWITLVHQICKKPSLSTRYARNLTLLEVYPKYFLSLQKYIFFFFFFLAYFIFYWPHSVARGISVPQPWIKSISPALKAQNLNHWTSARKSPAFEIFTKHFLILPNRGWLSHTNFIQTFIKIFIFVLICKFSCLPPLITPSRPRLGHSDCSGRFHSSPTAPLTSHSSVLILIQCQLSSVLSCHFNIHSSPFQGNLFSSYPDLVFY